MTDSTSTPDRVIPTNEEVAQRIGLTHSGVSRIRSGARNASITAMRAIENEYQWPIQDQIAAREAGTYAENFEIHISAHRSGLSA